MSAVAGVLRAPPDQEARRDLLNVEHLAMTFDLSPPLVTRLVEGQERRFLKAVDDVSFDIATGETFGLVGESGCGKSTVARCVAGLLRPTSGTIRYRGSDLAEGYGAYRREIQMIFQDPYGSLNPRWRAGRIIADPIRALKLAHSRRDIVDMVARLLESVGLSKDDAQKFPHQFSGGQRQRIAVARALASRPAFIICDEPTSALDVSVQAQILNLMRDLQDEAGLTYLFISHNLAVVDHMTDHIAVMYLGRIVEKAAKENLFRTPLHPYTRLLMKAMPSVDRIGELPQPMQGEVPSPIAPPQGCAFHPRCPFAIALCREERPELAPYGDSMVACHRVASIS